MPLRLAADLVAVTQRRLDRGIAALVWGLVIGAFGAAGITLLLIAAHMGLARAIGPGLATALMGAGMCVAALLAALWRRQDKRRTIAPAILLTAPPPVLPFVAFVLGYVAVKSLMRRKGGRF